MDRQFFKASMALAAVSSVLLANGLQSFADELIGAAQPPTSLTASDKTTPPADAQNNPVIDGKKSPAAEPTQEQSPPPDSSGKTTPATAPATFSTPGSIKCVLPKRNISSGGSPSKTPPAAGSTAGSAPGTTPGSTVTAPPPPPPQSPETIEASLQLTQAYDAYRSNPIQATFSAVERAFQHLAQQSAFQKMPAAAILKNFPVLTEPELGLRTIEAGQGRIFSFPRIPFGHGHIVQWADTKSTVTFIGKRHRTKKVTTTVVWHSQSIGLPADITVRQARLIGSGFLVLVGDQQGSSLWLRAFRWTENGWTESPSHFDSIPSFLKQNISGRVIFRDPDLVFVVAKVVAGTVEGLTTRNIPEAESSTYKFLLHLTDGAYVLQQRLPDEEQFGVVHQFLDSFAQNRTDAARSMLTDSKLLSIVKYVGVTAPFAGYRVAEMLSLPSGASRFRLLTGGKDDLIFDVGRYKDKTLIKAIFIASPDPWLQSIAHVLPVFEHTAPVLSSPQADDIHMQTTLKH